MTYSHHFRIVLQMEAKIQNNSRYNDSRQNESIALFPGSPLAPTKNKNGARGESLGLNKANGSRQKRNTESLEGLQRHYGQF